VRFRMVVPEMTGAGAQIFLDGKKLEGVTKVVVETSADDVNRVSLSFIPESMEVELAGSTVHRGQGGKPCETR